MLIIYLKFTIVNNIHYFNCILLNTEIPAGVNPRGILCIQDQG